MPLNAGSLEQQTKVSQSPDYWVSRFMTFLSFYRLESRSGPIQAVRAAENIHFYEVLHSRPSIPASAMRLLFCQLP
jgi:hypothetical protein